MRITKRRLAGALLGLSSIVACRGSDNTVPDALPDDGGAALHIQDVQSDSMAVNAAVELHGVVVTAVDSFGDRKVSFWVEEPDGGPFSGVQVFVNKQTEILQRIAPGDIVDIKGAVKTEFVLKDKMGVPEDDSGRTTTELQSPLNGSLTVTKTGTGKVPEPHIIDVLALDGMSEAARDAEYEKWEGVLVQVRNVRSHSFPQGFGSARPIPADSYKINVTDNLLVESTQTKFTGIDGLTCFASITGVADYFFDWLLLPRMATDVVVGTECAAVPTASSTITAIQAATPVGAIELKDVYVTARSANNTSFWISTSPTAAKNEGGYVFQSSSTLALDPAIVAGAKVTVIGTVDEFNDDMTGADLTEIQPLRITVTAGAPEALTPITGATVETLLGATEAPQYESVLVTLDNVRISAVGASANGFVATAVQAGKTFSVGTEIVQLKGPDDLGCYKTVTGFWTSLQAATATTKPNTFGFIVRNLGTKDGTCE